MQPAIARIDHDISNLVRRSFHSILFTFHSYLERNDVPSWKRPRFDQYQLSLPRIFPCCGNGSNGGSALAPSLADAVLSAVPPLRHGIITRVSIPAALIEADIPDVFAIHRIELSA
jgi:hypothetical protein